MTEAVRGREGTGFHQLQDYSELPPQCFYTVIVGGFCFFFSLFMSAREGIGPAKDQGRGGERRLGLLPTSANPHKRKGKKNFFFFLSNSCGWVFFLNVVVLLLLLIKYLVSTVCRAQKRERKLVE